MTTTHREVEVKFLVRDTTVLRAVAQLRSLGPFTLMRRHSERQRNTYVDTDDARLHRARAVLKVRKIGSGISLTFKQAKRMQRGFGVRREITSRLSQRRLDLVWQAQLHPAPMRAARRILGAAPLRPRLCLLTHRRRLTLAYQRQRIAVDVDRVTCAPLHGPAVTWCEVELEALHATPRIFEGVVNDFTRRFGSRLRRSARSKYTIGLALTRKG